ncbi:ArsR/SmtB family transcription factor [Paenibacillus humicola]|uniref:ArsR/SmtB family transcription factor n=1 Tax=Paenibacillus humicola TaxID=3110540 RepID=UPI00237A929A|nr:metalloregulator ArsR/SmtB family transcription factor [Paenibacillus humicola]
MLAVLAEPARLSMLELLRRGGPLTAGAMASRLRLNRTHAARHLRILRLAGIVEAHSAANRRVYKLKPRALGMLGDWLDLFLAEGDDRLDRLDDYLHDLQRPAVIFEADLAKISKRWKS